MSEEENGNGLAIGDFEHFDDRQISLLILKEVKGHSRRIKKLEWWKNALFIFCAYLLGATHFMTLKQLFIAAVEIIGK